MAKRIKIRTDLLSKTEYSKRYSVSRPTIDAMIQDGRVRVERISGKDYICIKDKLKAECNEQA